MDQLTHVTCAEQIDTLFTGAVDVKPHQLSCSVAHTSRRASTMQAWQMLVNLDPSDGHEAFSVAYEQCGAIIAETER